MSGGQSISANTYPDFLGQHLSFTRLRASKSQSGFGERLWKSYHLLRFKVLRTPLLSPDIDDVQVKPIALIINVLENPACLFGFPRPSFDVV